MGNLGRFAWVGVQQFYCIVLFSVEHVQREVVYQSFSDGVTILGMIGYFKCYIKCSLKRVVAP